MECHEYEPGEAGGPDYVPGITKEQLESLDLEIPYPNTPIAAIDASSVHVVPDAKLRVTFAGLVQVDHDNPSTPFEFNDIPLDDMGADNFVVTIDGQAATPERVTCTSDPGTPTTVIFAVDVTGSMSPAIAAVRDSLIDFVDVATDLGLNGKIGVVTFQDTVGVNIPFEDCSGVDGPIPERSPFHPPVALDDAEGVQGLRDFIGSLHADQGGDGPENLAAAVDFAANNVIGVTADGSANVIGEGDDDPPHTSPWPVGELEGLVSIIGITDVSFHRHSSSSSYLLPEFRPRDQLEVLRSLDGKIVSTIDPALFDGDKDIQSLPEDIDADFWPKYSGGFGLDRWTVDLVLFTESVSFFDLELLVLGNGLLEIPLAPTLASTCVLELEAQDTPELIAIDVIHELGGVAYTLVPERVSY